MSGRFTRKMYDGCAAQQNLKQSTDPLELVLDVNKYVHCNNICKPKGSYPPESAQLVDVESSLRGIDKLSSRCDSAKHPFCGPNGCLLTRDSKVAPHITPYACERGHLGDNAVVTTNMQMPRNCGVRVPDHKVCDKTGNGYYVDPNKRHSSPAPAHSAPRIQHAPTFAPVNCGPTHRAPVHQRAPTVHRAPTFAPATGPVQPNGPVHRAPVVSRAPTFAPTNAPVNCAPQQKSQLYSSIRNQQMNPVVGTARYY